MGGAGSVGPRGRAPSESASPGEGGARGAGGRVGTGERPLLHHPLPSHSSRKAAAKFPRRLPRPYREVGGRCPGGTFALRPLLEERGKGGAGSNVEPAH